ncbi:GNAT family N-acetyltransferase [Cryptosporangium sp. NPDC048952]|uniref:GNAT family N-acetyltransferase n=1 Tax=Cryptosporangium sp. NPDC048952 TaxID=3363961 RepID=UPI00371F86F1
MTGPRPSPAKAATPRIAYRGEADALAALVVEAFLPLPVNEWLVEDDTDRTFVLLDYFSILIDHALRHGVVQVIDGSHAPAAVAAWLTPASPSEPANYAARRRAAAGVWTDRFELLDDALAGVHLADHHHLVMLATRTGQQNQGPGSALLAHRLAELDRRDEPACLSAASPRSVPFYTRHGFVPYAAAITVAPQPNQAMTPLRRPPLRSLPAGAQGRRPRRRP